MDLGIALAIALCLVLLLSIVFHFQTAWLLCRLWGRLLELGWLYLPLLPLRLLVGPADALTRAVQRWRGNAAEQSASVAACAQSRTWHSAWFDLCLRNVQRSGPVFVKLGQWAATRPDIIPDDWCTAFGYLQDRTEPHSLAHTHRILDLAFTRKAWFHSFLIEPEPIGSGCIAQVYRGQLERIEPTSSRSGHQDSCGVSALFKLFRNRRHDSDLKRTPSFRAVKVAVKVIHPQVRRSVELDLKFLTGLAWLVDRLGFESLGVSLALRQFVDFLEVQADFLQEASALERFRANFGERDQEPDFIVPQVFYPWVTRDCLVMSFEEGEPLSTLLKSSATQDGAAKRDAWAKVVDSFWAMVFKHRLVHGDMHPGNVLWRRNGAEHVQLVLIDCGLTVDLNGEVGDDLSMMVRAFFQQSEEEVARLLVKLGERVGGRVEDVQDEQGFVRGIAGLIREARACAFKLSKLNAGALMGRSLLLGRKHRVRFDARFVNLMIAMTVLQGVALGLYPDGDFLSKIKPYLLGAMVSGAVGGLAPTQKNGSGDHRNSDSHL